MAQNEDIAEGFEIPLHVALTQQVLIAGVPRMQFYIVGVVCLVITLSLHQPLVGIPLWCALHFPSVYLAKRDPYFLAVFFRSFKHSWFTRKSGGLEG